MHLSCNNFFPCNHQIHMKNNNKNDSQKQSTARTPLPFCNFTQQCNSPLQEMKRKGSASSEKRKELKQKEHHSNDLPQNFALFLVRLKTPQIFRTNHRKKGAKIFSLIPPNYDQDRTIFSRLFSWLTREGWGSICAILCVRNEGRKQKKSKWK